MSQAESPTVVHSTLRRPVATYHAHPDALKKDYGVDPRWLPLSHRSYNSLEVLLDCREWLRERPVTSESVAMGQLASRIDKTSAKVPYDDIMLLCGWWPIRSASGSGTHYANPNYRHGHAGISDSDGREEILKLAADLALPPERLVDVFGVASTSSVKTIYTRSDVEWGVRRDRARARLARTFATLRELGYSCTAVAQAFGFGNRMVSDWTQLRVGDDPLPLDPGLYLDEVVR